MTYKLTYKSPITTFSEEIRTNQEDAQRRAWELIDENGRDGDVIIDRRASAYYGEFNHFLTVGFVKNPVGAQL